jgi:hypothetical protein
MSFVIAIPELVRGAAQDLAGIGSSLSDAASSVSGPTTGIAAAAQDEVSVAIASTFGNFGQEFQALNAQAQAFHTQLVNLINTSAGAYMSAEFSNTQAVLAGGALGSIGASFGAPTGAIAGSAAASTLMQDLNAFGAAVAAPYQALAPTTITNAQTVFGASQQALNTLSGGVSTALRELPANPAAFFGNLETALQSVTLIGANGNITNAVVNHTLGGVTEAMGGLLGNTPVYDAHVQVFQGLTGDGFELPPGPVGALVSGVANFVASPLSGVLLGAVGPFVSPGVALFNEAGAIFADLTGPTPNPAAALAELLDTPATVVNAFFNGATLNLDPFAPLVQATLFSNNEGGSGEVINGLSFAFGGLFSPGQVIDGPGGPMYYGTGGSALNSVGMDLSFYPPDEDAGATIVIPAIPVGPIGATAGLIDIIGEALGGSLLG